MVKENYRRNINNCAPEKSKKKKIHMKTFKESLNSYALYHNFWTLLALHGT